MKNFLKYEVYLFIFTICLTCTLAGLVTAMWWDWALNTIFHKDFNIFQLLIGIFAVELLSPKCLRGITWSILLLMTLYIFLVL